MLEREEVMDREQNVGVTDMEGEVDSGILGVGGQARVKGQFRSQGTKKPGIWKSHLYGYGCH